MSAQEVASEPPAVLTNDPVTIDNNTKMTQDAQVVARNEPELTNDSQAQSNVVNEQTVPPETESIASRTEITAAAAEDQSRGVADEEVPPAVPQATAEVTMGEDLVATPQLATYPDNANLISPDVDGIAIDSSSDLAPETTPTAAFDNTGHISDLTEIVHEEPVTEQETLQEEGVTTSDHFEPEPSLQLSEARLENEQSTDGGQDEPLLEEKYPEHDGLPSDTQVEISEEKSSGTTLPSGGREEPDAEGLTLDSEVTHPEPLLSKDVIEETHETQIHANAEIEVSHPEIDDPPQNPTPYLVEDSVSTQQAVQDEQLYSTPQSGPDVPTEVVQNDAGVEKQTSLPATDLPDADADAAEASLPPDVAANITNDGQGEGQEADETEDEGSSIQDRDARNDESSLQTALENAPEASQEVLNQPEDAVEISLDVVDDQGIDVTGTEASAVEKSQPEIVPPVQVDVLETPAVAAEPADSDGQPVVHDLGKSDGLGEHTEVTTLPQYDSHRGAEVIENRSFDLPTAEIELPSGNPTPHSPEVDPLVIPEELSQSQRHDITGAISTEDETEVSKDTDVAFGAPVDLPNEPTILESAHPPNHDDPVSVNLPTAGKLSNELDKPMVEERTLGEDHSMREPAVESEKMVEEVEVLTSASEGVALGAPIDLLDEPTILESAHPPNHDDPVSVNLPTAGEPSHELDKPMVEERTLDEDHSMREPAVESEKMVKEVEVLTSASGVVALGAPIDLLDEPTILESAHPPNHDDPVSVNLPTAGEPSHELNKPTPEERPSDEDRSVREPVVESENLVEVAVLASVSRGEEQSPNSIADEVATPEASHFEQQILASYSPEPQIPSFEGSACDSPEVQEAPEDMIVSHDSPEVAPEEVTTFIVDQATIELPTEDPAFTHNILKIQPNAFSVVPTAEIASDDVPIATDDSPQVAQEITEDIPVQAEATANSFLIGNITQSTFEILEPSTVDASEPALAVINDSSEARFDQPEVVLADLVGVPGDKLDLAQGILEDDTLDVGVVPSDILADSNLQNVSDEVLQATDRPQPAVSAESQDVQSEVVSVDIGQELGEVSKPVEPESDAVIGGSLATQPEGIPDEVDITKRDASTEVIPVDEERVPIPPENAQGQHHAVGDLGQPSVQERSSPGLRADIDQAFETNGDLLAAIAEPTIVTNERETVGVVPEPTAETAPISFETETGTLDPENDSEDVNLVAPALNEVVMTATPEALLATDSTQGPSVEGNTSSAANLSVIASSDLVEEKVTPPQFGLEDNPKVIQEEKLQLHDSPAAIPNFTQSSEGVSPSSEHEHEHEQKLLEELTPSDGHAPIEPAAASQVFSAEQPDFASPSTEQEVLVPSSAPVEQVSTLSEEMTQEISPSQEPTGGQTSSQSDSSAPVKVEEMLITDAPPTSPPDKGQENPNDEVASSDVPVTHLQDNVSTVLPLKEANEEGDVSVSSEVATPTLDGVNVLVEQSETGMDATLPLETRNVAESTMVMLPTVAVQDHDDPNLNGDDLVVQGGSIASELLTELPGAQDREPAILFFGEVSTKLASSEVDIERPKSPWTPSFSVTTQGPGIIPEEDIEPEPLSKEALVVPVYPNLVDDTVDSTHLAEQLERPWTPSYSVFVQGGSPHQEPKDELPAVPSLKPQESSVSFASDVSVSADDEPATMDPKEVERQVLPSLPSRAEAKQATASDVQSGTQSEASVEPQVTFTHSVVPLEDITTTVPRTENQIATSSSRELNAGDALRLSRPVQDGKRSEATKENLPPSNQKVQKADLQDELPPVEFPKLVDVGERALTHRLSLTVINENSEDHAVSKPIDLEISPPSPRTRLESTASSLMFPGGWFGKIPEGRTSLDNAHGVFTPSKPSASVLQPAPPPTPIAPSDEHERKGKWCIVM